MNATVRARQPLNHLAAAGLSCAAVLALDLATKAWAEPVLASGDVVVIGNFFHLHLTYNPGVAFGMFRDLPEGLRSKGLLLIGVATLVILWLVVRRAISKNWPRGAVFGMITGGALGNMYDRLTQGRVTDFLQFFFFGWPYPTFNVADCGVVIGFFLLLLWMIRDQREAARLAAQPPGFTLLEVMIAMSILAMSLIVLLDSHSRSIQMTNSIKNITVATFLARSKMIDIEAFELPKRSFCDVGEKLTGDFTEEGYPKFRWDAELKKIKLFGAIANAMLGAGTPNSGSEETDEFAGNSLGLGQQLGIAPESGMAGMLGGQLQPVLEQMDNNICYVRLNVFWPEGSREKSFFVVSHVINIPGASIVQPTAGGLPMGLGAGAAVPAGQIPGGGSGQAPITPATMPTIPKIPLGGAQP